MAHVNIVGDGPGGLSAALFLAKNGHEVAVYGQDKTAMHFAHIHNYLGIPEIAGSDFQEIARDQVKSFGAQIIDEEVTAVATGDRFVVTTASGESASDYLILTEGKSPDLARTMGLAEGETGAITVDGVSSVVDRLTLKM